MLIEEIEELGEHEDLVVFHEMYAEVKDFAIKEDYKNLSNKRPLNKTISVFKLKKSMRKGLRTPLRAFANS